MISTPKTCWKRSANAAWGPIVSTDGGSGADCPALRSLSSSVQQTNVGMVVSRIWPFNVSMHS
eukprot:8716787-Lingulodinium_polyedra.AAC.1